MKGPSSFRQSYDAFREQAVKAVKSFDDGAYRPRSIAELGASWSRMDYQGRHERFLDLLGLTRLTKDVFNTAFVKEIIAYAQELGVEVDPRDFSEVENPERLAFLLLLFPRDIQLLGSVGLEKVIRRRNWAHYGVVGWFTFLWVEEAKERFRVSVVPWERAQRYVEGLNTLSQEK